MRRINMYYEDIEYLLFTGKQNKNSIYDVGIDLKEREFRIETTDLYGHIQGTQIDGKLRRSGVKRFLSMLAELEFLSGPERRQRVVRLDRHNAAVMYSS